MTPHRHPKGSPHSQGGQFAKGAQADTPETRPMGLTAGVDLQTVPALETSVFFDADMLEDEEYISHISELEPSVDMMQHSYIAASQSHIADTAAELWLSQLDGWSDATVAHLRGLVSTHGRGSKTLTDLEIGLARKLQSSILAAQLEEPVVVFRGIGNKEINYLGDYLHNVDVGDRMEARGFWSTSADPEIADRFTHKWNDDPQSSVLLRIETNVGKFLPTSSLEEIPNDFGEPIFHEEAEVVLPHGGVYDVLDKKEIYNDMDEPVCLITLKYSHTSQQAAELQELEAIREPSDSEYHQTRTETLKRHVNNWMEEYEKFDIPVGGLTSKTK